METTLRGTLAEYRFTLDETSGFRAEMSSVTPEPETEILTVVCQAEDRPRSLPKLHLAFTAPQRDAQIAWKPRTDLFHCHHFQPWWGTASRGPYGLNREMPVFAFFDLEGVNDLTFALSDCRRRVLITGSGADTDDFEVGLTFPAKPVPACREYAFEFRVDRRRRRYEETLRDAVDFIAGRPENRPSLPVPDAAKLPFYSTWYQFQKGVTQSALEEELPLLASCGMKSLIIDDGWQTVRTEGGGLSMAATGDWQVCPEKFPDMRGFVSRAHALGVRVLLWVALPFFGTDHPELQTRFRGMFLPSNGGDHLTADPRYPAIRAYLVETCVRLVRAYGLDGLKLDFLDAVQPPETAAVYRAPGADAQTVYDGLERLLADVRDALTAIRPDIMIEFRQHYTGPAMAKYGNIVRASDCPRDALANRMRIADLRLVETGPAVHSDMIVWAKGNLPEVAALQLLNVLFAVPQVSVRLRDATPDELRMLRFWLGFRTAHRETLLSGKFRAENPEACYPILSAESEKETVTAVYERGRIVRHVPGKTHWIVNAAHTDRIPVDLPQPADAEVFDVFGEPVGLRHLDAGLQYISVPASGLLKIR